MNDSGFCCSKVLKQAIVLFSILCFSSSYAQVFINEVAVKPGTNATSAQFQSLKDCANPTFGNEYIELYNANSCNAADISCYIIATPFSGLSNSSQGAFRFPAGTVIPPLGFISIGGAGSGASIILPNFCTGPNSSNLVTGASRWYLDNFDQYVALYDAAGTPVDVVYWTTSANQANRWNNSAYDGLFLAPTTIPNPTACGNVSSLAGPSTFPLSIVNYGGAAPSLGNVIERTTDGGTTWATNAAPTLNSCNGTCAVPSTFTLSANVTQPTCANSNGSITINAAPAGTYNYVWVPNVSTNANASNLAAGTYSVTVSQNGCQKDTTINLAPSNGPSAIVVNTTNAACGQTNGAVILGTVTGGTAPYQYNFNNQGFSNNTNFSNLAAGSYTLQVRDAAGCIFNAPNVVITSANGPTAIVVNTTNGTCGQANGNVTLGLVTGGTAPYQYNFNNEGFSTTVTYANLAAGSYTLEVRDAAGCIFTAPNITITSTAAPTAVGLSTSDGTCGQANGQVTIGNVTGGTAPYQYNFNNLGFSSTTSYPNLGSGSYTLVVSDANGCTYTAPNININTGNGPTAVVITVTDASCGLANGTVTFGAVTGGSAPYQYNFNNQGYSTNINYTNIEGGNYTVAVQDANNCVFNTNLSVQTTLPPTNAAIAITPAICANANGRIEIGIITGGTQPYLINFNNQGASSTTTYSNLTAADYTVEISDANNCIYSTQVTVPADNSSGPQAAAYDITAPDCGAINGVINVLAVFGGLAPYSYNFNNAGFSNNSIYNNLIAGIYPIEIRDGNGCIWNDQITIQPDKEGEVVYSPNSFTPNGDNLNDVWMLKGSCIKNFSCTIFNRWGETITTFNNINDAWDGFYKNQKAPQDIYVFKAEITFESGLQKQIVGHINLIQ